MFLKIGFHQVKISITLINGLIQQSFLKLYETIFFFKLIILNNTKHKKLDNSIWVRVSYKLIIG